MKKMIFISVLAVLLHSIDLFAQTDPKQQQKDFATAIDAYVRKAMEQVPDIPAIAIVVIKNDQPVFLQAYGVANKETGEKAGVNTLFYIASSTKSFTALSAALLDKEGSIKLGDPLTKYTAGISFNKPIPGHITVRDLLTHTSGLKNEPITFRLAYSGQVDPKEIATTFAEATQVVDSGYGKYRYDNLGYNIYGILLQHTTGKKWQDLLQEKIFDPLNMKHTTAYVSKAVAKNYSIAYPYYFMPATETTTRSPLDKTDNNMQSAGGLFSSISDMGIWLNMNINGGKLNGKQIIPAEIVKKCHAGYTKTVREQPPFSGEGEYGLGWQIGQYKNEKVIYHHGGFPGYRSHVSFMPDKKIAVAVLTNDGSIGGRVTHMLATYAYDWWLQSGNVEESYARQLQDLTGEYEKGKKSILVSAADRAKRTSQLSLPLKSYAGTYSNVYFGTMELSEWENSLQVKMGNIRCVSTAFTQKETIRVEMVPGSGEVIRFKKNAEDKIESLSYAGFEFEKLK